jgi:hypothetical protein
MDEKLGDSKEGAKMRGLKRKYLRDAIAVIDGRVAELKNELQRDFGTLSEYTIASDRAAIAEAEHCARLIATLADKPYRGDPYGIARRRWAGGDD